MAHRWIDGIFVGKKMQGVPPLHDGSQDRKWIKEGKEDVMLNSPLVALSGSEGGFAEMESPVVTDGQ